MAKAKKYLHELSDRKIDSFINKMLTVFQKYETTDEDGIIIDSDITEAVEKDITPILDSATFIVPDEWYKIDGVDLQDAVHPMDGLLTFQGLKSLYITASEILQENETETV